jgi:sec-independent protein translocase protein TatB
MEIFNIGTGELLFILLLALLVLGPRRIPEVARTLGRAARELRAISDEFTRALTREVEAAERAERAQKSAASEAQRPTLPSAEEPQPVAELAERPPVVEASMVGSERERGESAKSDEAPVDGSEG